MEELKLGQLVEVIKGPAKGEQGYVALRGYDAIALVAHIPAGDKDGHGSVLWVQRDYVQPV